MTQGDAKEDRPLEYQTHTRARVLSPREPQDKPVSGCGIDLHADAPPQRHGEATVDSAKVARQFNVRATPGIFYTRPLCVRGCARARMQRDSNKGEARGVEATEGVRRHRCCINDGDWE